MSTNRSKPLKAERGSSQVMPARAPLPVDRGGGGADGDVTVLVAGGDELAGHADGGHEGDGHGGAVVAADVVGELVQVVGEGVPGVGTLVELDADVTGGPRDGRADGRA
jgi:hypothetical protein